MKISDCKARVYGIHVIAWCAALWLVGCAGPGPVLFPVTAVRTCRRADHKTEQWYDVDGNGRPDYCEIATEAGRVVAIGYDRDEDGRFEKQVDLAAIPPEQVHHLVIILDSVPVHMVREVQAQGRLRYFPRPTRVIAPFPVMTDVCLTEFFGVAPLPGVESSYYDGRRLHSGYGTYLREENAPWVALVDYHLSPSLHPYAYIWQQPWYMHELRRIQEIFTERDRKGLKLTVGYVVGTSALGARQGRDGHIKGLVTIDRFCQEMVYRTEGRVCVTLFSDHGHNLLRSRRIPLRDTLGHLGYRPVTEKLSRPDEVVVPEFGMVSCAAIYTRQPARVAGDAIQLEGVELAAYKRKRSHPDTPVPDEVVVLSRSGRARIEKGPHGFRYLAEVGDPLQLKPILKQLADQGQLSGEGFVEDTVLYAATADHVYPDAVHRLWRAFHGLMVHTPDVLLSLKDGYQVGNALMADIVIEPTSVHGNLRRLSSYAFAVSMAGRLPETIRTCDLRSALQEIGIPLPDPPGQE